MADKKISQLTAVTMPLAETEVLPIVQSGTTKKVTVAELTTLIKHTMTMDRTNAIQFGDAGFTASINYNDDGSLRIKPRAGFPLQVDQANIKFSNAGYGIDFSANGGDVLSQYDEGTWTPADFSGAGLALTAAGSYTRIGRMVFFSAEITYPVTVNAAWAAINGLPFARSAGAVGGGATISAGVLAGYTFPLLSGATGGYLFKVADQGTHALNSDLSGQTIQITGSYTV